MGFIDNYDSAGEPADATGRFQKGVLETDEGSYELLLEQEVRDGLVKRVIRDNESVLYAKTEEVVDDWKAEYDTVDFYKSDDLEGELARYDEDSFNDLWNEARRKDVFATDELDDLSV